MSHLADLLAEIKSLFIPQYISYFVYKVNIGVYVRAQTRVYLIYMHR